jgi:sugar lactone lactonase YvrE
MCWTEPAVNDKKRREGVLIMRLRSLLLIVLAFVACQKNETTATDTTPTAPPTTSAAAKPPQISEGLQTPESVLYDPDQDVYFISNINGQPLAADDNGYISRVDPERLQGEMKWIDGSKPNVTLNAPKGMAIVGDTLYVTDISIIRKFNRKTGAPEGEIGIIGTTFLNDAASDGTSIYVSDTGMKAGKDGKFEPSGTDGIWKITSGTRPEKIASGADLKAPNGVVFTGGKLWVVSYGANELYQIDNGKKTNVTAMPKGGLDGLVALTDGSFLVSSWDGKAVYRGKPGGAFTPIVENVNAPADIGYDTKRNRLLIPHFMDNIITIHNVQ